MVHHHYTKRSGHGSLMVRVKACGTLLAVSWGRWMKEHELIPKRETIIRFLLTEAEIRANIAFIEGQSPLMQLPGYFMGS